MAMMFRAAVTPDAAASSVTAGPSQRHGDDTAPDGPAAALDPTFEVEVSTPLGTPRRDDGPATAGTSASNLSPSRRWRVLVDEDMQWKLDPRRVTVIQVAGGAL
jgi:hypothetical protein